MRFPRHIQGIYPDRLSIIEGNILRVLEPNEAPSNPTLLPVTHSTHLYTIKYIHEVIETHPECAVILIECGLHGVYQVLGP